MIIKNDYSVGFMFSLKYQKRKSQLNAMFSLTLLKLKLYF
ncbi:hypothetical protein HMPREF1431_01345 [Helicobacter pylori GAMchJs106B]|nr:hypothetical protein HMPREF1406_00234 [Helicobacter pylori GAM239Bi]EMH42097.1 hypothetical protein HMPREF1431_01345 [Helicobacter pylori GAMchJs106B]